MTFTVEKLKGKDEFLEIKDENYHDGSGKIYIFNINNIKLINLEYHKKGWIVVIYMGGHSINFNMNCYGRGRDFYDSLMNELTKNLLTEK